MEVVDDNEDETRMDEDNNNKAQDKRRRSSLRSVEADLKVIVGGEVAGENGMIESEEKVYWHYSPTVASQSGYVDAFLSTHLPTEMNDKDDTSSDYKEISFPDVSPSQWERMIRFVNDPLALQSISPKVTVEPQTIFGR